jgi:hypothetical protein
MGRACTKEESPIGWGRHACEQALSDRELADLLEAVRLRRDLAAFTELFKPLCATPEEPPCPPWRKLGGGGGADPGSAAHGLAPRRAVRPPAGDGFGMDLRHRPQQAHRPDTSAASGSSGRSGRRRRPRRPTLKPFCTFVAPGRFCRRRCRVCRASRSRCSVRRSSRPSPISGSRLSWDCRSVP